MNIIIISPGKSKGYMGEDIVLECTSRISHYSKIEWKFVNEIKNIPDNSFIVVLDEKGKSLNSMDFSDFLNKRLNESVKNLVFIIGDAYGVDDKIKEQADFTWSLSDLVFPHELVRSILAEQIYRGFSILRGEKYHHE